MGACFGGEYTWFHINFKECEVIFDGAQFIGYSVDFSNTGFGAGGVSFSYTQFKTSIVKFEDTHFRDGNVNFIGAHFGDGNVNFKDAHFGDGDICFRNVTANTIWFYGNTFCSHIDLRFKDIISLFIEECKFDKTIIISGNPKILSLKGTVTIGQIHFSDEPSVIVAAIESSI